MFKFLNQSFVNPRHFSKTEVVQNTAVHWFKNLNILVSLVLFLELLIKKPNINENRPSNVLILYKLWISKFIGCSWSCLLAQEEQMLSTTPI